MRVDTMLPSCAGQSLSEKVTLRPTVWGSAAEQRSTPMSCPGEELLSALGRCRGRLSESLRLARLECRYGRDSRHKRIKSCPAV